jgi:glutamyl/glutaminyl-tRNA synthetase
MTITFKQALQECHRYTKKGKLDKAILYLNVMMKKSYSQEEKEILNKEKLELEDLLSKDKIYENSNFKKLEDLENISLSFHEAKNEYDEFIKN